LKISATGGADAAERDNCVVFKSKEKKEEEARLAQEQAERRAAIRQAAFETQKQSCPLPIQFEVIDLPAGLALFDDEFIVSVAKDWGLTTKKLILTTRRIIHAKGTFIKDQESVALTDISDINFHKGIIFPGEITIETSGGHSITGLPFAKKSKDLRNQLMALVDWAKNRANQPVVVTAPAAPVAQPDRFDQLAKIGELRAAGILTEEEFAAQKAALLGVEVAENPAPQP
jgi:hypothetical protein